MSEPEKKYTVELTKEQLLFLARLCQRKEDDERTFTFNLHRDIFNSYDDVVSERSCKEMQMAEWCKDIFVKLLGL